MVGGGGRRKGEMEAQMVKQKDAISRVSARDCTRGECRGEGWKRHCLKWQLGASAEQGGSHDIMSDNDCIGNHVRQDDKDVYQSWRWHENGGR